MRTLAAFRQLSIRGRGEISDANSEPSVLLARTDAVPVPARPFSHYGGSPKSSSRRPFGVAKRDLSLREATGPEHHRRVTRYCSPEGASPVLPGGPASPGAARFPPLPVVLCERVLDLAVLRPRQRVLPLQAERPHVRQTRLLHHPSGGEVDRHRLRPNAAHAELGEAVADQDAGAFGGVTLAPGEPLEPVAELVPLGAVPFRRVEGEPPHELPGGLLDGAQ
jgi:hypothetical protein